MGTQPKEFPSLLFTPRTLEKQSDGQRSRSPHSTRSPSISAYGRSTAREGSASRRRSITPTGSRETPPPPPPTLSLLDSTIGLQSTPGPSEPQGDNTFPLQPQESTSYGEGPEDMWVTVYGFNPEDQAAVLREFGKCGDILRYGSGREDKVNWVHLKYGTGYQVQRALHKNGQVLNGRLMVGVKKLEEKHKVAIESLTWPSTDSSLRSTVKPVTIRPYKLDNPAVQGLIPSQSSSVWSKLNEFVLGL